MLKRINIFILFIIFILFLGIDIKASDDIQYNNLYDGFSVISGNKNISNDLIYKIRYSVIDSTDENINGEINYQFDILGDSNINGKLNVLYRIENSYGVELKVTFGDVIIYDLVFNEYASIYECNIFDFTDYTDKLLYIGDFTYKDNYFSKDSNSIALYFYENTKLDYLLGIKAKKGQSKGFTFSNIAAKEIEELYLSIEKEYDIVINHTILESNYSPISNYVKPGNYKIKILSVDAYNDIYLDKIYVYAIDDNNYFYCDNINVNFDDPISDEMIFKYYVHYYDKDNIKSYKIESDYKYNANVDGIYDYKVTIIDNDNNELFREAKITVGDFSKPLLIINYDSIGDGSYKSINDIFDIKAYDNRDLDITSLIKIKDIDDYEHNYNKIGTYRFLFSVSDSNSNENNKLIEYKVYYEDKKEENEEIEILEENEDKKEDEKEDVVINPTKIKYEFYTDNETSLTREMIRQKLIFSGFYKENDNFSMNSEYFDNKDKNGTYILYVNLNDEIDCYSITVRDKEINYDLNEEEEGLEYRYVILGSVVGLLVISGIAFVIIKKVKKKK